MKLLKFYASWCGPCKQQTKILERLNDVFVQSIDADDDDNEELIEKYGVRGLPTLILLNDAEEVLERFNGLTTLEEINSTIKKYEN